MKFLVKSRLQLKKYKSSEPYIVISIYGKQNTPLTLTKDDNRKGVLFIQFDDIDEPIDKGKLISDLDIDLILGFFEMYKQDVNLTICQCEAGISRSAAVAAALAKLSKQSDTEFFKKYIPNRYVYKQILNKGLQCKF